MTRLIPNGIEIISDIIKPKEAYYGSIEDKSAATVTNGIVIAVIIVIGVCLILYIMFILTQVSQYKHEFVQERSHTVMNQ